MKRLKTLSGYLPFTLASTSNVSSKLTQRPDDIKQLNGSVWEFFKPPPGSGGVPKMEILFFHGAHLSKSPEAFWTTWLSRDETVVWPTAWLAEKFPTARILFVSYDSAVRKSSGSSGQKDTYQTIENLMQDIVWSSTCKAGQKCPVIFVGHCFGGIIIKDFLIRCAEYSATKDPKDRCITEIKMFLQQCKAIFYYSTPNAGSRLMDGLAYKDYILGNVNQSVVDFLEILSQHTARINSKFSDLRHNRHQKWETRGIGETLETKLTGSKRTMVVPEASARYDLDQIYWAPDADHFDVSRAKNSSSCSIFAKLYDLVLDSYHVRSSSISPLPFGRDKKYVSIVQSVEEVRKALEGEHEFNVITLCGEPGLGKTSLVKHLALQYQPHHSVQGTGEASAIFPDGVFFLPCGQGAERKVKQLQNYLLQTLGCESEAVPTDIPEEQDGDYVTIPTFRRRSQFRLRDLKALIILDDVWERRVLEELILSPDEAGSVKYLLTSQFEDMWPDAMSIPMRRPTFEEARQILHNYTKGFASTGFPESIKDIADSIILHVDFHPLTLATLGLGFEQHEGQDPEAWNTVRDIWRHELPVKDVYEPSVFGKGYPFALDEAMTRIVALLKEPARDLLFLICALQDSYLPQTAVKYLYKCANNGNMSGWRRAISHLRNSSLVDVYFYPNSRTHLVIHKLRSLSIRSRFPSEVRVLLQRALQPVMEMYNNRSAQTTLIVSRDFEPALQPVREMYNYHSAQMTVIGTRNFEPADGNNGLLSATMMGMYMNNIFLEDARMQIPRGVDFALDFAVDNLLTTAGRKNLILRRMVELLHPDPSGEEWKREAARCAEKIIVRFACRHELDEESVVRLMQLPEACGGVLSFLADTFRDGYWRTQFFLHNQTFSNAYPLIARKLFALVHNHATSTEMIKRLVRVFLGGTYVDNGMLDYENDDVIVDIGEQLIKLALRENANISLECGPLQTFPSSESRTFRVIEKKIPDLWKAMLRLFVQKYTGCDWLSSLLKESNAPPGARNDTGALESLCAIVDRLLRTTSILGAGKMPWSVALNIFEWLSLRADLSISPGIMPGVIHMLVRIFEGFKEDHCVRDAVGSAASVLRNLAMCQETRQKILSTYPLVAKTLERLEKSWEGGTFCPIRTRISTAIGILDSEAEAVHIKISDYSPPISQLQFKGTLAARIRGYFLKKKFKEFLTVMDEDLFTRDMKSEVMVQIIVAKAMLKRYQSALGDACDFVNFAKPSKWSNEWLLAVALGLRGSVKLLSGEDCGNQLRTIELAKVGYGGA